MGAWVTDVSQMHGCLWEPQVGGGVGDRRVADARLSVWEPQVGGGVGGVWVGVWVGSEKIQRMGVISKRSKNSQPHGLFRPPPQFAAQT